MARNASIFENGLHTFGPTAPVEFDFTALFEYSFLSIAPSSILAIGLPFRLVSLIKEPRKVSKSLLHTNKLCLFSVFAAFQAAALVIYATTSSLKTPTTIAAAALGFVVAVGLTFLSHLEHSRSVKPSAMINTYLFVTLLFDAAFIRSMYQEKAPIQITALTTTSFASKLIINALEAIEKRSILLLQYQNGSPETTAGIYSQSFFWWLNSLLRIGFQEVLTGKELYPMENDMKSSILTNRINRAWEQADKQKSHALFWTTIKTTGRSLAACILPRLCLIGFRYAQPFLLSRTIHFASSPNESDNIGWGLTGAFGLVFVGMAVSNGAYKHMCYRFITTVRGCLIGVIYTKTVDLSVTARDESASITLMSNDTEAICHGLESLHELWAVPVEMGLALWLLERQLGLPFLASVAAAMISIFSIIWMSRYFGTAQKIWNEGIQTRVGVTASMLGSVKAVKLLGYTEYLRNILQGLRMKELHMSILFRRLFCARILLANSFSILAPLLTFIVFVLSNRSADRTLDASVAYTTMSLIALLASPVTSLLGAIPSLISALACLGRVQSFLESECRRIYILPLNATLDSEIDRDDTALSQSIELQDRITSHSRTSNPIMIDVRNASFSWKSDGASAVKDVTFQIIRHTFSFIIGPVGCGKSTLLRGLMAETPSLAGFVYSSSPTLSYVDQTIWIQNKTIRANILGQSIFDERWYARVLWACALDHDVSRLPSGSDTIVGSGGVSLSGGQKQRLAIARAIYTKKDLLIIDDAFSGLDNETEEKLYVRLLGNQGLLRESRTTVIVATHAVHRLPYADYIIALDSSGSIAEQGSLEQLRSVDGYVTKLSTISHVTTVTGVSTEPDVLSCASMAQPNTTGIENLQIEQKSLKRQNGELSTYKYFLTSVGWMTWIVSLSLLILSGVSAKLSELLITLWTNAVTEEGNNINSFYLGMFGVVSVARCSFLGGAMYFYFLHVVPVSARELHSRLLGSVMGAPLYFFTSTDVGMTTNRFSQDMSIVENELAFSLLDVMISLIGAATGAVFMCISSKYFALTIPPLILIVWVIQKFYLRTSRQIRLLDLEAKSPLYSHFMETLSGVTTLRAFGWSNAFVEQNFLLLDASQKPYYLLFCIQRWLSLVLDLTVAVLAVVLMVLIVKFRGSIGPGFVGLALLNVMSFSEALAWIIRNWTDLETSIGAVSRLENFTTYTPVEDLPGETQSPPDHWPAFGAIEISNLSASYVPGDVPMIRDINMCIAPGERVGICGRTGSGKSTLTSTLFRLTEISPESSIIIDGVDITTIPRQTIRSRLNAIPQDPLFLKGTIRENLDPGTTQIPDAKFVSALQKVQLWEIVESKGGLDVELLVEELFSHGQRQLFCLARAMLRRSKVLILDEVTSNVDLATDELMQRVIREEFEGVTILSIAHRLQTVLDFDRIALLSDGKLMRFDKPEALLNSESTFGRV